MVKVAVYQYVWNFQNTGLVPVNGRVKSIENGIRY